MFFLAVNSILPDTSTNRTQKYYKKMKRASLCPEIITQNTFFNSPVHFVHYVQIEFGLLSLHKLQNCTSVSVFMSVFPSVFLLCF